MGGGTPFIHVLDATGMVIGMRGIEVDFQVADGFHDGTYLDIPAGGDAGWRHHTFAPQEPVIVHRLVDIAVVDQTEGEIQSWRQHTAATRLSKNVTDIGHETRQEHRVLLTEADIDGAYRHQQTGNRLRWFIPPLVLG